jgi:hypothetical protein
MQAQKPSICRLFNITRDRWAIFSHALATSTWKMYAQSLQQALNRGGKIPVLTCDDVITFFAPMAGKSRTQVTRLRQALFAFQTIGGFTAPPYEQPGVKFFFKALLRMAPAPTDRRLPMTEDVARAIYNFWARWNSLAAQRNAAFFVLHMVSLHRFSEVAACKRSHLIDLKAPNGLIWFVPKSKTDQQAQGHSVAIPEHIAGNFACAIVLRRFLNIAPNDKGLLFRPTTNKGTEWAPLRTEEGNLACITVASYNATLRYAIKRTCPTEDASRFSSHSLRSGGATSLIEQGVSLDECRALLGHMSHSAIKAYHKKRQDHARSLLGKLYTAQQKK